MRHSVFARFVLAAAVLLGRTSSQAEPVDAVLATVDKEVVLYSELLSQIGEEIQKLRRESASAEEFQRAADELVKGALEEAINARLLVREAKKLPQLEVSDKELDVYMEEIRGRFDNPEDFVKAVAGSVSDFREDRRKQIMAQRMSVVKMKSFEDQVVVSEEDVVAHYSENQVKFERPERVYLRQIFLRVQGGDAERAQARARLESLRGEIAAGTDFADLAKLHSQGPEAAEGGAIGWQQQGDLVEPLNTAAFALEAGGLSEVLDSQFGVHLLKVDQHEKAGTADLKEMRSEIEKTLRQEAAKKKYDTWLADLRKRSRVRIFL